MVANWSTYYEYLCIMKDSPTGNQLDTSTTLILEMQGNKIRAKNRSERKSCTYETTTIVLSGHSCNQAAVSNQTWS